MAVRSTRLPRRPRPALYIGGAVIILTGFVLTQMQASQGATRWASLALLPLMAWFCFRLLQVRSRAEAGRLIGARLSRLPDDFVVLHDLQVPAPWGVSRIDHVILSRFGLVVAANGPTSGWMLEQVEAVRSYLIALGATTPSTPVRALVLLPPGTPDTAVAESDAPVVRVEQVRLGHVAPSRDPVIAPEQVRKVFMYLQQLASAAS